jgi:glycosyltransferase involved in cell wall biosynthesis
MKEPGSQIYTPLISVLIPTYNVERFVEAAIRSVMNQTYQSLEIIIVDDCSTDKTYEILQKLAHEDGRIRLYKNEVNKKIVDTLNFAFTKASGTYIARMDSDDISLPFRIEKQLAILTENPEIDLVGLSYIIIDEQGNEIQREKHLVNFEMIKRATKYVSPVPHFWLAKKEVYDKVGPYRIPGCEDYDFVLRTIDHGFKVSNSPEYLYLYRMRNGNTLTSSGLTQKKSFRYIQKLHKERISHANRKDSFSLENLKSQLRSTALEERSYQISSQLHHKHIIAKKEKKFISLVYLGLALALSPRYLMKDKFNRFFYKRMLWKG